MAGQPDKFIVYRITHRESGKQYIGQTKHALKIRWRKHLYDVKYGSRTYLHSAIRKHGPDAFDIEVLDRCETAAEAKTREIELIAELRTFAKRGYNLTIGGDGVVGHSPSADQRRAMSEATKRKWSEPDYRRRSKESMSAAQVEAWTNPQTRSRRVGALNTQRNTPAYKSHQREAMRKRWQNPETRSKLVAGLQESYTPERRARHAESARKGWEKRRRNQESRRAPETTASDR